MVADLMEAWSMRILDVGRLGLSEAIRVIGSLGMVVFGLHVGLLGWWLYCVWRSSDRFGSWLRGVDSERESEQATRITGSPE